MLKTQGFEAVILWSISSNSTPRSDSFYVISVLYLQPMVCHYRCGSLKDLIKNNKWLALDTRREVGDTHSLEKVTQQIDWEASFTDL